MAFASSIPVAATRRDLGQGWQEARGHGLVMLPPGFAVLGQVVPQAASGSIISGMETSWRK